MGNVAVVDNLVDEKIGIDEIAFIGLFSNDIIDV